MPRPCDPTVVASARNQYETTDDPLPLIAARHGISLRTLVRWARNGGWKRRSERPLRALPEPTRLLGLAIALEAQAAADQQAPVLDRHPRIKSGAGSQVRAHDSARASKQAGPSPTLLTGIESAERQVHAYLAAEEAQAHRTRVPTRAESADAARTLATLTQTLQKLAALRRGETGSEDVGHDEFPQDIDERRLELARRIHAFIDSRTGGSVDGGHRR